MQPGKRNPAFVLEVLMLGGFLFTLQSFFQLNAQSGPTFEVASIKLSRPDNGNSNLNFNPGRFSAENVTLLALVKEAYGLNTGSEDQVIGAPAWIRTTAFDISAKEDASTASKASGLSMESHKEAVDQMLQHLLGDYFKLRLHEELRDRTVTALVLAKTGSKLKPAGNPCHSTAPYPCKSSDWQGLHNDGHGHIEGKNTTIKTLADVLSLQPEMGGRIVIDGTGLPGKYDFDLHYRPDSATSESEGESLSSGLLEQLGLKAEAKKLPIKVLVIENIEHPAPN